MVPNLSGVICVDKGRGDSEKQQGKPRPNDHVFMVMASQMCLSNSTGLMNLSTPSKKGPM